MKTIYVILIAIITLVNSAWIYNAQFNTEKKPPEERKENSVKKGIVDVTNIKNDDESKMAETVTKDKDLDVYISTLGVKNSDVVSSGLKALVQYPEGYECIKAYLLKNFDSATGSLAASCFFAI